MNISTESNERGGILLLQYIKWKSWGTDLHFFKRDLEFLKSHIKRNIFWLVENDTFSFLCESLTKITSTEAILERLTKSVEKFGDKLDNWKVESNPETEQPGIQGYSELDTEFAIMLIRLKEIKTMAFSLTAVSPKSVC
ncbi:MAG: hypothetical protein H7Y07_15030 [Pyrinomonadaceae bacterium]|nr:hypothetical protein [Sphingobacteriaceae bacterium]